MKSSNAIGVLAFLFLAVSYAAAPVQQQTDSLHLNWIDKKVNLQDNFYSYANGSWQKNNPIPPEYASWGTFNVVNNRMQDIIHQMLIKASKDTKAKEGSIEQKIGDFYYSGMNEKEINKVGITPLKPELDAILSMRSMDDLQKEIGRLHLIGVDALFGFGSMQDFENSSLMVAAAIQGGLGLPDRDYYLKNDEKFKKIREAYWDHLSKIFVLLGEEPKQATEKARTVLKIETDLASASKSQIELRDPHAIYHMKSIDQLNKLSPNFSWSNYLASQGLSGVTSLNYATPEFFQALNKLLTTYSIKQWQDYLRWHLIDGYASYLSQPFVDQDFKMAQAIAGTEKLLPRWKRVVNTESGALGFAIGKMYVEQYFPEQSKQQVIEMLNNIRAVMKEDIQTLTWMTPETKIAALKKLDLMEARIGYPSVWWDYSGLKVDKGPYVLNVLRANQFLVKRDLNKIGKPIDRTEWAMTPQSINAYYDPSMNNLNIPAGILQPPFFDPSAPPALNYGSIGFVMGHEMTHGFDDQGAQFDGHGNLHNWWSPGDLVKFQQATQCIADQFSNYVVDGDLHVQGKLVVGEAAADLGGITLAYKAFLRSKEYQSAQTISEVTPEQQFFLGTAHVWAMNIRPLQLRNQVTVDPHPPAQYRVNGSLANIPQFQESFAIPNNSPMVSKNRCVIW